MLFAVHLLLSGSSQGGNSINLKQDRGCGLMIFRCYNCSLFVATNLLQRVTKPFRCTSLTVCDLYRYFINVSVPLSLAIINQSTNI